MLNLLTRRRAEDHRVDTFLAAIHAAKPAPVRPLPMRMDVPSPRTDTERLPRIVLTAGAVLTAAAVLTGCGGGSTPVAVTHSAAAPSTVQLELPVAAPAPAPVPAAELTGTDAGLITAPAPTVEELEDMDRAATAVPSPAAAAPVVPAAEPAAVDVPAVDPAPVTPPCATGEEWDPTIPACVAVQLPEERTGGARCEDPTQVVLAVLEDGTLVCGVA